MENTKELLSESKGELIQKLNERYGIGKSVTYKRLEFLEISIRLAAQYKDNPDLLPEDLRSKVRATEEAVAPKSIDPEEYALSLIAKMKAA